MDPPVDQVDQEEVPRLDKENPSTKEEEPLDMRKWGQVVVKQIRQQYNKTRSYLYASFQNTT